MEKKPRAIIVSGHTMSTITAAASVALAHSKVACVTGTRAHTPSRIVEPDTYEISTCYYHEIERPFTIKDDTPPGMGPAHAHIVSKQRKNKRKGWK